MDIEILEDLGLTASEIKTYITLLELGSSSAGKILEKSGLQNSVVHRALNSLIEKGLVNFILEGRIKIYQATDPEHFRQFIDNKKQRFEQILPELKKKQSLAKETSQATIYKGKRGITEIYYKMISLKGEYLTFGGGEPCVEKMGLTWWNNLHKKRVANKLPSRQLFDESVKPQAGQILKNPMTKVRFLSKEFAQFQETVIVGDYVAINVFTENPYGILIKDSSVARGYKKYFEMLWKLAK